LWKTVVVLQKTTDKKIIDFAFKNRDDDNIALVCKKCNEVIFIKSLMNRQ